jgi:hypothetical protein
MLVLSRVPRPETREALTFHHNTGRDKHGPGDGLGVEPDALEEGHVVLLLGSHAGIVGHLSRDIVMGLRLGVHILLLVS